MRRSPIFSAQGPRIGCFTTGKCSIGTPWVSGGGSSPSAASQIGSLEKKRRPEQKLWAQMPPSEPPPPLLQNSRVACETVVTKPVEIPTLFCK